jgi:hypothetical protein
MSFFSKFSSSVAHLAEDSMSQAVAKASSSPASSLFNELGADKVIQGLKEALVVAVRKAVASTGQRDGFMANDLIRIGLPSEVQAVASGLRSVGAGSVVDNFELSMNRAAESAAPLAVDIFVDAIGMSALPLQARHAERARERESEREREMLAIDEMMCFAFGFESLLMIDHDCTCLLAQMTFDDAKRVWKGKEPAAASKYLERACTPKLKAAFAPQIGYAPLNRNHHHHHHHLL